MRHATMLVAILAFVPLASATAQVRPGARVRVTGHFCQSYSICVGGRPEHRVGTFVAWQADTLVVRNNTGIGFLLGGVVGAVIGYASYEECVPQGWFSCIGPDFGPEVGGLGGLMVGAIIGGSPEVRLDRLRVSLGLQRNGWFGLGASVRF